MELLDALNQEELQQSLSPKEFLNKWEFNWEVK